MVGTLDTPHLMPRESQNITCSSPSSNSTFVYHSSGAGILFQNCGWLVVVLLSLSLALFIAGVINMRGGVVTTEPDLEDDWHPLFNPFKKTIVVEEYVLSLLFLLPEGTSSLQIPSSFWDSLASITKWLTCLLLQKSGQPREPAQLVLVSTTIRTTSVSQHLFGCKGPLRERAYLSILVTFVCLSGSRLRGHSHQLPLETQDHQARRTPFTPSRLYILRLISRLSCQRLCQLHPNNRQICTKASSSPIRRKDANDLWCCRYIHCCCLRGFSGS